MPRPGPSEVQLTVVTVTPEPAFDGLPRKPHDQRTRDSGGVGSLLAAHRFEWTLHLAPFLMFNGLYRGLLA